jgi:hypothetical protein
VNKTHHSKHPTLQSYLPRDPLFGLPTLQRSPERFKSIFFNIRRGFVERPTTDPGPQPEPEQGPGPRSGPEPKSRLEEEDHEEEEEEEVEREPTDEELEAELLMSESELYEKVGGFRPRTGEREEDKTEPTQDEKYGYYDYIMEKEAQEEGDDEDWNIGHTSDGKYLSRDESITDLSEYYEMGEQEMRDEVEWITGPGGTSLIRSTIGKFDVDIQTTYTRKDVSSLSHGI